MFDALKNMESRGVAHIKNAKVITLYTWHEYILCINSIATCNLVYGMVVVDREPKSSIHQQKW